MKVVVFPILGPYNPCRGAEKNGLDETSLNWGGSFERFQGVTASMDATGAPQSQNLILGLLKWQQSARQGRTSSR